VVPLDVPPLRERGDDVLELASHFLEHASTKLGRGPFELETAALELLTEYHWPGNVRELQNIVTRACVLNQGRPITADELRPWLAADRPTKHETSPIASAATLDEVERRLIETTLERFGGHRARTAEALGIGVRTLSGKLRAYGYAPREKRFARAG
jgi:DNA-binding NtrC family response regulator